jgi:hypothetical protein
LQKLMAQTINVSAYTGTSTLGDPTFGAAVSAKARVEPTTKMIENAAGEMRQSEFAIYTGQVIGDQDLVWLPGVSTSDATKARRPMKVYTGVDEDGTVSHYEVYV